MLAFAVFVLVIVVVGLYGLRDRDLGAINELQRRVAALEAVVGSQVAAARVATSPAPASPAAPTSLAAPTLLAAPASPERVVAEPHVPVAAAAMPAQSSSTFADADAPRAEPRGPRERSTIERVIAEHALALVGGVFVLAAAVFFVGYAIDQGWIGPWGKFGLALAFAALLEVAALRVASKLPPAERDGRAIGSLHGVLAATGAGVAFIAIVAAVRVQELLSATTGAALEMAVAVGVVLLAHRWRSQDLAGLGLGVGLAAPMLVGAEASGSTVVLLAVAIVAACAAAVLERWPRLLLAASLITAPQLASYAGSAELAAAAVVTIAWWAVLVAACVVSIARDPDHGQRSVVSTVFATSLAAVGLLGLAGEFDADAAIVATFVLAGLHVALGVALLVRDRDRFGVLSTAILGAGATVAAIAIADATDGAGRAAGWAAEVVALTMLWDRTRDRITAAFAWVLAAVTVGVVFILDAPVELLEYPTESLARPLLAVGSIVVAALAVRVLAARRGADASPVVLRASGTVLAASLWYLFALVITWSMYDAGAGETWIALGAWAAVGSLLAAARFASVRHEEAAIGAMLALVVEAAAFGSSGEHVVVSVTCAMAALAAVAMAWRAREEAAGAAPWVLGASQVVFLVVNVLVHVPPWNLRAWGSEPLGDATIHLALLVLAATALAFVAWRLRQLPAEVVRGATIAGVIAAWYAVSIVVVALFTDRVGVVEQDAQVALTLTWVALGAAALFAGTSARLREHAELRIGGYALLALGAIKLVLVDTVDLETPMRVLAFLVTGLGLLGSAALEQRMRGDERD